MEDERLRWKRRFDDERRIVLKEKGKVKNWIVKDSLEENRAAYQRLKREVRRIHG